MKTKIALLLWLSLTTVCLTKANNNDNNINAKHDSVYATIAGIRSGVIEKETLIKAGKLVCSDNDCKMVSFTFLYPMNGDIISISVKGDSLTDKVKNKINEMKFGDRIYIEDIIVIGTDGTQKKLTPMIFKISYKTLQTGSVFSPKNDSPYVTIAGLKSGLIEKDLLLKAGKLECLDKNCRIINFKISYLKNKNIYEKVIKGDSITDELMEIIENLELGSKLYFEDIIGTTIEEGSQIKFTPMVFKILDKTKQTSSLYNNIEDSPFATISGLKSGLIEKDSLLKGEKLECSDKTNKILSFKMSFIEKGIFFFMQFKSDSLLTPEMIEYLNKLERDDKLYIEDIIAIGKDGTQKKLTPMIFIISDKTMQTASLENSILDYPFATIAGIKWGSIKKDSLLKTEKLVCSNSNFKIVSFTFHVFTKQKNLTELISKNDYLTDEMKKEINKVETGSKIYIEDIKAEGQNGYKRNLANMILIISEK